MTENMRDVILVVGTATAVGSTLGGAILIGAKFVVRSIVKDCITPEIEKVRAGFENAVAGLHEILTDHGNRIEDHREDIAVLKDRDRRHPPPRRHSDRI